MPKTGSRSGVTSVTKIRPCSSTAFETGLKEEFERVWTWNLENPHNYQKKSQTGDPGKNSEDQNVDRNVDSQHLYLDISDGNQDSVGN